MVTINTGLAINTGVPGDRTTAGGFRRALGALFRGVTQGTPTAGILRGPGTPLEVTLSGAGMQYGVSAGYAVTTRTGQGAYLVGTVTDVVVATAAADGTNPRIDRIYIVQPDPELSESGVARIDVVNGTPGASPTLPALPTGALELGRVIVPAGASNTAEAAGVTNRPATMAALYIDAADVEGLTALLNGKANVSHSHTASAISDPQNLNAGSVDGISFVISATEPVSPPANNFVWFDTSGA